MTRARDNARFIDNGVTLVATGAITAAAHSGRKLYMG